MVVHIPAKYRADRLAPYATPLLKFWFQTKRSIGKPSVTSPFWVQTNRHLPITIYERTSHRKDID